MGIAEMLLAEEDADVEVQFQPTQQVRRTPLPSCLDVRLLMSAEIVFRKRIGFSPARVGGQQRPR